jgi:hypothetical protein
MTSQAWRDRIQRRQQKSVTPAPLEHEKKKVELLSL